MRIRYSSCTTARWFSKCLLRDGQPAHAVGLEPQRELELVRRQDLVVVRAIAVGRAVEAAAAIGDEPEMLALGGVLTALEHHVLEQVREAGSPARPRCWSRPCR